MYDFTEPEVFSNMDRSTHNGNTGHENREKEKSVITSGYHMSPKPMNEKESLERNNYT
jgi:hypothetical protein